MLNALNAFPSPECFVLKRCCLQLDTRLLPFAIPNGFSTLKIQRFLLALENREKGFLFSCASEQNQKHIGSTWMLLGIIKRRRKKGSSFFPLLIYTPCIPFTTYQGKKTVIDKSSKCFHCEWYFPQIILCFSKLKCILVQKTLFAEQIVLCVCVCERE